jgi:2-(1,2-epoxy-1,2-dihydrophenyl)acetyl-CoA isomerase
VNRSVAGADLVRRTREMARAIAHGPTAAFLESKRIVGLIAETSPSRADLLAAEAAAQGRASRTHDYQDGITAFQEKRKPTFTGR